MSGEEKKRWGAAAAFSIACHLALLFAIKPAAVATKQEADVMSVRLVVLPGPRGGGGGGDGGKAEQKAARSEAAPQKAAAEQSVRRAPQKPRQNVSAAKRETAAPVPRPEKVIQESSPQPQEQQKQHEAFTGAATQGESDAAVQASGEGAGSGGGVGGGAGTGVGSGVGSGSGGAYGLVADLSELIVTKKVMPEYPLVSRKRREEGTAVVIALVENDSVTSAELEKSSGHSRLDASALKAASGWKFRGAGTVRVRIPFAFKING